MPKGLRGGDMSGLKILSPTPNPAGIKLDLSRKNDIDWLGPFGDNGHDWALLDGVIYSWSESNIRYESAWWLNTDGTPVIEAPGTARQSLLDGINKQRPFDPKWLLS